MRVPTPQNRGDRKDLLALVEKTHWNISEAARKAGLNRSTFFSRMKKLGITK